MTETGGSRPLRWPPWLPTLLLPVLLILLGTRFLFHPIFESGMERVPGDVGDARLIHLFLEHNYQVFVRGADVDYWSPHWLFFPVPDGLALSDVLTGAMPLYAVFRLSGADPVFAYQQWFMVCAALDLLAAFVLLRRIGVGDLGAGAAAFVYGYGSPRAALNNHPQLLPSFFVPLVILCVVEFLRARTDGARFAWSIGAGVLLSLQFWTAYYVAWFLLLAGVCGTLLWTTSRRRVLGLVRLVRRDWSPMLAGAGAFAALTMPLLYKYWQMKQVYGARSWGEALWFTPELPALILPHARSWLYADLHPRLVKGVEVWPEKALFAGFLMLLAPTALLVIRWLRPTWLRSLPTFTTRAAVLGAGVALVLTLLCIRFYDKFTAWIVPFLVVPGANAMRAVGRITLMIILPAGLALGALLTALEAWRPRWGFALALVATSAVVAENVVLDDYSYARSEHDARVESLVAKVRASDCSVFYYSAAGASYAVHLDAMWASLVTGVPTVNGYSGFHPPGYGARNLDRPTDVTQEDVQAWLRDHGQGNLQACVIR